MTALDEQLGHFEAERLRAILEVIHRDHDCADSYATAQSMAFGLVVERRGKLHLTQRGRREMRAAA